MNTHSIPTNSRNATMVLLTVTSALGLFMECLASDFLHSATYGQLMLQVGFIGLCYSFISGVGSLYYYRLTSRSGSMKFCWVMSLLLVVFISLILGLALLLWLTDAGE